MRVMQFQLPEIGRMYYVVELNRYVVFRKINVNSRTYMIRFDLLKDNDSYQTSYDPAVHSMLKEKMWTLTFETVDNAFNRRRRPLDYVNSIREAVDVLTKSRYRRFVTLTVTKPLEYKSQFTVGVEKTYNFYGVKLYRLENGSIEIRSRRGKAIHTVNITDISMIKAGTYVWKA